ncbi:thioredoxin family protein [Microbacterium sp. AZCO]|uniref:thioredoxin family protein n=1 Tax=Microbacterium sp. AZCO TaxID=3142976 RepID=UPI0031F3AAD1
MKIEVLHIDDCPNWKRADDRIRQALDHLRDTTTLVECRLIHTREEADALPFAGSPTITLDDEDLFPGEGRTSDLACRVYVTPDGLAGMPTVDQLVEAIGSHGH